MSSSNGVLSAGVVECLVLGETKEIAFGLRPLEGLAGGFFLFQCLSLLLKRATGITGSLLLCNDLLMRGGDRRDEGATGSVFLAIGLDASLFVAALLASNTLGLVFENGPEV